MNRYALYWNGWKLISTHSDIVEAINKYKQITKEHMHEPVELVLQQVLMEHKPK